MLNQLKSDLRKLKFGKDQPDGGNSGLPYIKTPLPENGTANERILLESARFSADYPIRGGLYAVRAAEEDAIRIRKFLTDFPKGSNFTSKQVGLQKSNPLIETGKNGGRINTQTYNLNSNLLLSTLTAGSGIHYPRPGATPLTLLDDKNNYSNIVSNKPTEENRLINLLNTKILNIQSDTTILDSMGISQDEFQILNYPGGPDSLYGDGDTIIFKATDNKGVPINTNNAPKETESKYIAPPTTSSLGQDSENSISSFLKLSDPTFENSIPTTGNIKQNIEPSFNTLSYPKIINKERYIVGTNFKDFRKDVNNPEKVFSRDYEFDNMIPMTTRIGIGSPGARPRDKRTDVNIVYKEGQDKVNMIPIIHRVYADAPETEPDGVARDLIKFNFETIDNNNIDYTYRTHFRAFLKGFNDNHNADWAGKKYSGRGENMYTYQGFDRRISFNFTISAQSKQEMKPLYQKLNFLTSTICPDYSPGNGFMRGNIHRLTIGEYLYRVPGVITSLNLTVDDNYPWEIKMDQPENGFDDDMMELTQLINVSVSFIPILDTLARTGLLSPIIMSDKVGVKGTNFFKDKDLIKTSNYPSDAILNKK